MKSFKLFLLLGTILSINAYAETDTYVGVGTFYGITDSCSLQISAGKYGTFKIDALAVGEYSTTNYGAKVFGKAESTSSIGFSADSTLINFEDKLRQSKQSIKSEELPNGGSRVELTTKADGHTIVEVITFQMQNGAPVRFDIETHSTYRLRKTSSGEGSCNNLELVSRKD